MWIKNLNVFQAQAPLTWTAADIEARLADALCPPCGSQTLSTVGFAPVLKGQTAMTEHVEGMVCALHQETARLLPGPVVAEAVEAKIEVLESETGRAVGRRERGEIKDEVVFDLLPRAFTRSRRTALFIDLDNNRVWVDCAATTRAEDIVSTLREALGTLPVVPLNPSVAPAAVLTQWLREPKTLPEGLSLGDRCELQGAGETRASVRCTAVDLHTEEILAHLEAGMQVAKINLCWDDALEFDLDEQLTLKRLRPLDQINDSLEAMDADDAVAELQAQLALQGGALRQLQQCLDKAFEIAPVGQSQAA